MLQVLVCVLSKAARGVLACVSVCQQAHQYRVFVCARLKQPAVKVALPPGSCGRDESAPCDGLGVVFVCVLFVRAAHGRRCVYTTADRREGK